MKKTVLAAITVLMATSAHAGGIVGNETKYTGVVCTGADTAVNNFFVQGTESLDADKVVTGQTPTFRIFDDQLIESLIDNGLIEVMAWDKTNWFKSFGVDIKNVGDYLTLNKSSGDFHNIGGGVMEYKSALALANGDIDKLPKTLEGQPRKQMLKINVRSEGQGVVTVDFNRVTSAVHKCTKTELVPNIWAPLNPELPKMVEQCVEHAHVADAITELVVSKTLSVGNCSVGTFPHQL